MSRPRTLIIGIDGATFDLLTPWIHAGELPHLSGFVEEGAQATLWAWPNTNSAAAWTSMVTGCNGGKHGVFDFGDTPPQVGERWRPMTAAKRRRNPFWCFLSDAGQSVGVVNVPISYPSDPVRGFMVSGMDAPSVSSAHFTQPPELAEELRQRDYRIDVENLGALSQRDPAAASAALDEMTACRADTTLHLMRTRDWQTLMVVFVATDRAQHHFWPQAVARNEQGFGGEVLLRIYRRIDRFIGEAIDAAGEESLAMVVSDHGFGSRRAGRTALNHLFAQLGLLHFNAGGRRWGSSVRTGLLSYGRRLIPRGLQRPLAMGLPRLRSSMVTESRFTNIDWSKTSVFAGPHGSQVYVNQAGRQQRGIVPVSEKDDLMRRVRDIVVGLTDPDSGVPVVRSVALAHEIYDGPHVGDAPDMIIEWDFDALRDRIRCRTGDRDIVCGDAYSSVGARWIGEHRPNGVFLARGPAVRRARLPRITLYDIAPTVLYARGVAVPADMDGRVLTEIFHPEHVQRYGAPGVEESTRARQSDVEPGSEPLDPGESALIEERLRGLGYIE